MTPPSNATLPDGTHIGRTALRVAEPVRMTEFYREVVGLGVLRSDDERTVLGAGDTPLLVLDRDEDAPDRRRSEAGLYHTAFRVPSREALGDALGRIREQWELGGASDHDVSEALYLTDPEGNGVEIYRDLPREEWPLADDGRVRIGTHPLDLDSVAEAAAGTPDAPAGTDVGHVHLEVTSIEAFREFAVDTIGFEVQTSMPAAVFVSAGGYHHHLGANTWNRRSEPARGRGLSWFEAILPGPEPLATVRDRVADGRYRVAETDDGIAVVGPDEIEVRFRAEP